MAGWSNRANKLNRRSHVLAERTNRSINQPAFLHANRRHHDVLAKRASASSSESPHARADRRLDDLAWRDERARLYSGTRASSCCACDVSTGSRVSRAARSARARSNSDCRTSSARARDCSTGARINQRSIGPDRRIFHDPAAHAAAAQVNEE